MKMDSWKRKEVTPPQDLSARLSAIGIDTARVDAIYDEQSNASLVGLTVPDKENIADPLLILPLIAKVLESQDACILDDIEHIKIDGVSISGKELVESIQEIVREPQFADKFAKLAASGELVCGGK